jgi:hypothetical protein
MYAVMVWGLMVVLPIVSIGAEWLQTPGADIVVLIGKWFVFWAVGVRLLTAGLKQMLQPAFTAKGIFHIEDPKAFTLVIELGISNLAIGVLGVLSLYFAGWTLPAAVYGIIFYGIAAFRHLRTPNRTATETLATWSDLWAAVVLAVFVVGTVVGQ